MAKIRLLYFVDRLLWGGIQTFLENVFQAIDKESFDISLLVLDDGHNYANEIKRITVGGITYYQLQGIWLNNLSGFVKYKKALKKFFKEQQFDIVHINSGSKNYLLAKYAQKSGAKVIYHSHNTGFQTKNIVKTTIGNYLKRKVIKYSNHLCACSKEAAAWLFSPNKAKVYNATIINNALNIEKLLFNNNKREDLRKKFGLDENTYVLGHVGRFEEQKNHRFLIELFHELSKTEKQIKLFLIGDGSLKEEIKKMVSAYGLESMVIFQGAINNAIDYYNLFDCFVMPSLFEGLPLVGVEAQVNGLPCYFSDTISSDVKVLDSSCFIPISNGISPWVSELRKKRTRVSRDIIKDIFSNSVFDAHSEVKKIEQLYYHILERNVGKTNQTNNV